MTKKKKEIIKMFNEVMFSSKTGEWATPRYLFDMLDKEFHFTLDPCADEDNHKCSKYFTKEQDGLIQSWENEVVFCNPPYGREIYKWVQKCVYEVENNGCKKAVMLIPSRTDTKWFHDFIYKNPLATIQFLKGRIKFGGSNNGAPFPSMIVIFEGGQRQ